MGVLETWKATRMEKATIAWETKQREQAARTIREQDKGKAGWQNMKDMTAVAAQIAYEAKHAKERQEVQAMAEPSPNPNQTNDT